MPKVMCIKQYCPIKEKCARFAKEIELMQNIGVFKNCNHLSDYKNFWEIGSDKPKNPIFQSMGEWL